MNRRQFLRVAGTASVAAMPVSAPAVASLLEAGAALCVAVTVTAAAFVCVVRLCRPKYVLYFHVSDTKPTNGGREYLCLSCTRAEAETRELTKCQYVGTDLSACQALAATANTNYQAVACGPVPTEQAFNVSVQLKITQTPAKASSWVNAGDAQTMNLNDDDPSVTFTVPMPRRSGNMFFRASAVPV